MENTLYYILAAYGISAMLVYYNGPGDIIANFRKWCESKSESLRDLFQCMFCLPVWVGAIASVLNMVVIPDVRITPFYQMIGDTSYWWIIVIGDAFSTAAMVSIMDSMVEYVANTEINNNGDGNG